MVLTVACAMLCTAEPEFLGWLHGDRLVGWKDDAGVTWVTSAPGGEAATCGTKQKRSKPVVFAPAGREAEVEKLATALGASVEPLTWTAHCDFVVAK
jgi:hypothetical protein